MVTARDVDPVPESRGLLAVCMASSSIAALVFGWCVVQRFAHPFELEWMEGGSLQHLLRVADGLPLYAAPTLEFVPFPYPPLYYYAALPFAHGLGFELSALRAVSVLSTVATAGLLFGLIRFETRRLSPAVAGAGLYLATYLESGAYMDVARLDAVYFALVLAAVLVLRVRDDTSGWVVVGLLAAAATLTKQTAPAIFAPLILWAFAREKGAVRAASIVGVAVFAVALGAWIWSRGDNSAFFEYVLAAQAGHEIRWWMVPAFFGVDLFYTLPVVTLVGLWGLWRHADRSTALFYVALFTGVVAACIVPRVKVGGALNNLIPLHATAIALGCVAWGAWSNARGADSRFERMAIAALLAQFLWLGFDPRIAPPKAGDAEAGARFVEQLRRVDGEVLMPAHGYLAGLAGKSVFAHQMPIDDIEDSGLERAASLREDFVRAIEAQRFALVIDATDRFLERYPNEGILEKYYRLQGPVFSEPRTLIPRSGWGVSPGRVWVPRPSDD